MKKLLLVLMIVGMVGTVFAGVFNWDGGGSNNYILTYANWDPDATVDFVTTDLLFIDSATDLEVKADAAVSADMYCIGESSTGPVTMVVPFGSVTSSYFYKYDRTGTYDQGNRI